MMSRHMISVCIFCIICATHSPCASHAATRHETVFRHKEYHDPSNRPIIEKLQIKSREKLKPDYSLIDNIDDDSAKDLKLEKKSRIVKRNSDNSNSLYGEYEEDFINKIFRLYGNGDAMTVEGFEKLVTHLHSHRLALKSEDKEHEVKHGNPTVDVAATDIAENDTNDLCLNDEGLMKLMKNKIFDSVINQTTFYKACPLLVYSVIADNCPENEHKHHEHGDSPMFSNGFVWLCSILAVIVISACGVLSLAIIPVMQKRFYKPLIQFLVALAVGTLAGDALLHLLPHAMSSSHDHGMKHHHENNHSHEENTMKGCVAMLGLTFFFIMERLISLAGKWRKGKQKHKHSHVLVINDGMENMNQKNDAQCMDKYNSVPYCYNDIMNNPHRTFCESDKTATTVLDTGSNSDIQSFKKSRLPTLEKLEANQNNIECSSDLNISTEANKMLTPEHNHNEDYTVILREHKNDHHGHSHKHGHVHSAPQNLSSVAWMVIMGDGLHNFTDGMAIGAAFSGGLAGGFSTTVAVFCHELPHELGDFAMLLKAGMTIKQAFFYNILSSVLCIFGNIFGLILGNTEQASSWVFAAAAGMFIYIALVDMIPELSSAHEDEGNLMQCILHLGGLLLGFSIMALIALYENDIKNIFNETE